MAATYRLTSIKASSVARPVYRLTSVSATTPGAAKTYRLTLIAAASGDSTSAVYRLTSVAASNVVSGTLPIGEAGSDIQAAPAETWQLEGSDSSTNGVIIARQWTQLSKTAGAPDLVLDDATVATPSFVAPILDSDVEYLMGYVVTEDTGLQSEQDTMTVYVTAADIYRAGAASWEPMGLLIATTSNGWV